MIGWLPLATPIPTENANADFIKDLGADRHPYGRADRRCLGVYPLYDPLF